MVDFSSLRCLLFLSSIVIGLGSRGGIAGAGALFMYRTTCR
jgi:hypothetical protein